MRGAAMRREVGIAEARGERVLPVGGRERPHLCFVAPHIWPVFSRDPQLKVVGGAEVQQSILARLLAREGYRVSIVTFDYGQPRRIELDGVTVHKTCRPGEGVPVLRFLHPRLTTLWRALKEVDADAYYQRSASMLTGVIAEFCRRYGKRSIYAGASDLDFIPGNPQIRFARDRWLYEHGLRTVDRIVAQNRTQFDTCRAHYGREALLIPSCYESPAGAARRERDRAPVLGRGALATQLGALPGVLPGKPLHRPGTGALSAAPHRAHRAMSSAAKTLGMQTLKRRALSLGVAKSFDYLMQF